MFMENDIEPARAADQEVAHVEKTVRIQFIPRSFMGRVGAVAFAVSIVALAFLFFATAIALVGLLAAIAIGRVLWLSTKRPGR